MLVGTPRGRRHVLKEHRAQPRQEAAERLLAKSGYHQRGPGIVGALGLRGQACGQVLLANQACTITPAALAIIQPESHIAPAPLCAVPNSTHIL